MNHVRWIAAEWKGLYRWLPLLLLLCGRDPRDGQQQH